MISRKFQSENVKTAYKVSVQSIHFVIFTVEVFNVYFAET